MVNQNKDARNDMGSVAAELITRGADVIAVEHDQMRKIAVVHRRNPAVAMETAIAELKAFPELAEKGYYSIPRKGKGCTHAPGKTCESCIRIEGASVGATRVVSRCWGNCTAGVRVSDETDEYWDLEGRFMDFETNFSATRGLRLLKRVKWGGQVKLLSSMDPQMEMQIFQAGVSKAWRNVVRDGVPEAILERYWREAKLLVVGKQPNRKLSKKAVKKILDAFAVIRVSAEMLEEHMGRTMDEWTQEDAGRMRGLLSAIEGGETQVGQVFGATVREPEPVKEPEPKPEGAKEDKPPEGEKGKAPEGIGTQVWEGKAPEDEDPPQLEEPPVVNLDEPPPKDEPPPPKDEDQEPTVYAPAGLFDE
ncbi:MAG: hypothetical protein GY769_08185 [bacterium]|nr:hypothetical protein [bacterium]